MRCVRPVCLLWALVLLSVAGFVAGCGSGSNTPPPISSPQVARVAPATVPSGSAGFTLTVTGSGFVAGSTVSLNGTALVTTFKGTTSLTAAVPANLVASGGSAVVTVANPDGGKSSASGSGTNTVQVTNPVPTLTVLTPSYVAGGAASAVVELTGTNFVASSMALVNGSARPTEVKSATDLAVTLTAADLGAGGTLSVAVMTPGPGGGTSVALPFVVLPPTPVISAIAPTPLLVGSGDQTVAITGMFFTASSTVQVQALRLQSTFVSTTSLLAIVPGDLLQFTGSLPVQVFGFGSSGGLSNTVAVPVVNPVPAVTSVTPANVTAGAPDFGITISGSGFVSGSSVTVNGLPAAANGASSTALNVTVPAAAVAGVGMVEVVVTNPAPGGGASNALKLNVIAAANRVRVVDLPASDVAWDPQRKVIYASIYTTAATNSNSVVTIDPATGKIVATHKLAGEPSRLSITDDQQFLYVAVGSSGTWVRLSLPDLTETESVSMGTDASGRTIQIEDIAAAPGAAHTVAVTTYPGYFEPGAGDNRLFLYDDATARPQQAVGDSSTWYGGLAWGADATTLYSSNAAGSGGTVTTLTIGVSGVTGHVTRNGLLGDFTKSLLYDRPTNHFFDGYGNVADAATGSMLGQYVAPEVLPYEPNPFAVDSTLKRVFLLIASPFDQGTLPFIQSFDEDKFTSIDTISLQSLTGGYRMIRWGGSGLAVAGSQITIVDGPFVAPGAAATSQTGGYAGVSPVLQSLSPSSALAGSGDTAVTVTGRDLSLSSEVQWQGQTLPTTFVSATEVRVTLPAAMLATASAKPLMVSNGPGSGTSNALGFAVMPAPDAGMSVTAIPIAGRDLVWDGHAGLLYVAVPDTDALNGNQIVSVDPTSGTVKGSGQAGSAPQLLAISDDDSKLYAGFGTLAQVQRYSLPGLVPDMTMPLPGDPSTGRPAGSVGSCDFAEELAVAPGHAETFALMQGNPLIEPRSCGVFSIVDGQTVRQQTLPYPADYLSVSWTSDDATLFAGSDVIGQPQVISRLGVSSMGAAAQLSHFGDYLGDRVHYDATTNLVYADGGGVYSPADLSKVATFPASGLMVPDAGLGVAFFLGQTADQTATQSSGAYTLQVYDLRQHTLIRSVVLPAMYGYPTQLVRWGATGLAYTTDGAPGMLYLIDDPAIATPQLRTGAMEIPVKLTWDRRRGFAAPKRSP